MTLEQAKKKFRIELIAVTIILAAINALVFVIAKSFIIFVAPGSLILLCIIAFSEKKKIKRNFCPACHAQYNYETDVRWSVTSSQRITRQSSPSHSKTASFLAEDKALVHCECVCRGCGKVTKFNKNITVCKYYSDGSRQHTNLREYMRRYFKL